MIYEFKVVTKKDPRDIHLVEQFGWLDIKKAYENGVISGDLEGVDNNTNGIEDSASIFGRPNDVFEAMRMKDAIESRAPKGAKSESSPISPNGPTTSDE